MAEQASKNELGTWSLVGLVVLVALWAGVILRHVIFYDEFATLTVQQGLPEPPPFPAWQRIAYAIMAGSGGIAALGLAFRRSWGVYLFICSFVVAQTFAFAIGQWGLPSFILGLAVVILGMNYLHDLK